MSAFQILISPPARKPVSQKPQKVEETIPRLLLAPFSGTPEIKFGEVLLNAVVSKNLIIFNPSTSVSINIQFSNIDAEDRISVSEAVLQLRPREEKLISISWSPIHSGYLRKVIRAQDVTRKARSFDVVLSGMAVNKATENAKKKKQKTEIKTTSSNGKPTFNSTITLTQSSNQQTNDFRRQTYTIAEKENRVPADYFAPKSTFKASSPKNDFSNWSVLHENSAVNTFSRNIFNSYDTVDAPTKYSNFESELDSSNLLSSNLSDETHPMTIRRSTFSMDFKAESEENVILSPLKMAYLSDSLEENSSSPVAENITFDLKSCEQNLKFEENVFLTPQKNFNLDSILMSPPQNLATLPQSVSKSSNCLCSINESAGTNYSSKSDHRDELLFISPPNKFRRWPQKSPETFIHRTGSSAIKDRKKHLRTSFISRRRTPPGSTKKLQGYGKFSSFSVENSVEKIRAHNPRALKQAVSSQCQIEDPFLKQVLYNDDKWMDEQEKDIIKWMNSVLVPPIKLDEENPNYTVDAAEVWLKRNRSGENASAWSMNKVPISLYSAPETVALLRRRSQTLRQSDLVKVVFHELSDLVSKGKIYIRDGRDIYADEGIKNKLLQLLACYNPLWLRMGLECLYDKEIALQPRADIGGLGLFVRKTVLGSSKTDKKSDKWKEKIRKDILLKFLQLIFFMDQARVHRLFRHNRCLFTLSSPHKSSQDLLNAFVHDLVAGYSDIWKTLKKIGYVLKFKQTCVDEYDYTINSLKDLNDGVRLTRLFEILFAEPDLCSILRVPAVDIENKKFNVNVAMNAAKRRCTIEGKITPEDFVLVSRVGSRMKVLSFLWQVINNYLTPLYEKAAIKIQRWWRVHYVKLRSQRLTAQEQEHQTLVQAVVTVQRRYRSIKLMKECHRRFERLKSASIFTQRLYRANVAMREKRNEFLALRQACIVVQRRYRSNQLMREYRDYFERLKRSAVFIQQRYRAKLAMRAERERFLALRQAAVVVQRRYRSTKLAKECHNQFQRLKRSSIVIQRYYRANVAMREERCRFLALRQAVEVIQRRYRSIQAMKECRNQFEELKTCTLVIQRRYRANVAMRNQRNEYLSLKRAAVTIQQRYRSTKLMKACRDRFSNLKAASIAIQRRHRANVVMRAERDRFLALRQATILVQRRYRSTKLMKECQNQFDRLRTASIVIQRRFRANLCMRAERNRFLSLRQVAIVFQRRYRSIKSMKKCRNQFEELKRCSIVIQRRYRANVAMRVERNRFLAMKQACILVQRRYRSTHLMRECRNEFQKLKKSVLLIQQRYRANVAMRIQRNQYTSLRRAAITVQRRYRSIRLMRNDRNQFQSLKRCSVIIQRRYRAKLAMQAQRNQFLSLKQAAIAVQRRYRSTKLGKECREQYKKLRTYTIVIQQRYRATLAMRAERKKFKLLRQAVVTIQRKYRARRLMQTCRISYLKLRMYTLFIQQRWRTKRTRAQFLRTKAAALRLQKWWRTIQIKQVISKPVLSPEDEAATKIQALWRGYISRKKLVLPKNRPSVVSKKEKENPDLKSTLGERYKKAIYDIKTSDLYSVITLALWNLERVTTFSAKLCEGVVAEGIVPIIFSLIARGNRSVPALQLYRASIGILINLTLYHRTKIVLWSNMNKIEDISLILHLMKITHSQFLRKDEVEVFRYSVTFLWLLCQDKSIAEFIANIPGFDAHLDKMKDTLLRTCPCSKRRNSKRVVRILPTTQAKWYADPVTRTFDDNCFALLSLIRVLYSR